MLILYVLYIYRGAVHSNWQFTKAVAAEPLLINKGLCRYSSQKPVAPGHRLMRIIYHIYIYINPNSISTIYFSCTVHYSVCLENGAYFDSSRDKGTPFRFKLGQCMVSFFSLNLCGQVPLLLFCF